MIVPLHWPKYACGTAPGPVAALDEGGPLAEAELAGAELAGAELAGAELAGVSVAADDADPVAEVVTVAEPDDPLLAVGFAPEPFSAVTAITAATATTTTVATTTATAPISNPRRRRGPGAAGWPGNPARAGGDGQCRRGPGTRHPPARSAPGAAPGLSRGGTATSGPVGRSGGATPLSEARARSVVIRWAGSRTSSPVITPRSGGPARGRGQVSHQDGVERRDGGVPVERVAPGDRVVQRDPERPAVHRGGEVGPLQLLGGHVGGGADHSAAGEPGPADQVRDAEVGQLDLAGGVIMMLAG